MSRWIKCSDRLPERYVNVLLAREHPTHPEVTVGWLCDKSWDYLESTQIETIDVRWKSDIGEHEYWTHWMPIPAPPEAE